MNDFYCPQYVHGDFSLSRWIIMHYCGDNISPVSNKRMLSTSVRSTLDSEQCRTTFAESFGLGSTFFVLSAGVHSCLFWAQISHRSFQVSFHDWPPYHGGGLLPFLVDFFFSSPWWVFLIGPSRVKFTEKIIHLYLQGAFYSFGNMSTYMTSYMRQNGSPIITYTGENFLSRSQSFRVCSWNK